MPKHVAKHPKKAAGHSRTAHHRTRARTTRPAPRKEPAVHEKPISGFAMVEEEFPQPFQFVETVALATEPEEVDIVEIEDWPL